MLASVLMMKCSQSCFLQLKLISKIRSFLSTADLQVKQAFIHSWLDYCNALYSGIGHGSSAVSSWYRTLLLDSLLQQRDMTHAFDCLPEFAPIRVDFKNLLLTFKALSGLASNKFLLS